MRPPKILIIFKTNRNIRKLHNNFVGHKKSCFFLLFTKKNRKKKFFHKVKSDFDEFSFRKIDKFRVKTFC